MRAVTVLLFAAALSGLLSGADAFYGRIDDVVTLDPSNFDELVGANDSVWAVELFAEWCGHCKNLTPEWKKAAKALKGISKLGAVDADTHREIGSRFNVKGFPTIKILYKKGSKLEAVDYSGGRTASAIVEGVLQAAAKIALSRIGAASSGAAGGRASGGGGGGQGGCGAGGGGGGGKTEDLYGAETDILKLTDATFHEQVTNSDDLWLVEFYAPWCGHCKRLAPEWDRAATALQGKVKLGAVDCTAQQATCQEFGVQGYPTIKVFGEDKERPADYDGGRDEASITSYALDKWRAQLPPPQVRQLVDQEGFIANCAGSPADTEMDLAAVEPRQLCFLAFLPDILDTEAAGRNAYIDVLKKLAEQFKTRPFSYLWVEGGSQPALEASVGVGGYGFPALVAVNPAKLKYAALRSAFEYNHVKTFVDHVRTGTERVVPVQGDALPAVQPTEAWDGGDGIQPEADEFDLSDLMSDEL